MIITGHNVTIEARAFAAPVNNPEITEVIDLISGEVQRATAFIAAHRYSELVEARVAMREATKKGQPRHICAICGTPVHLVANMRKRFFFRHKTEDGSCPAVTRSSLSEEEIRARKYHGLRESEAHKRIKQLIERSLRADPAFDTGTIVQEKRWNAADDPQTWRKPDVQATSAEGRFAFEAQLSTTFLDVVVSRRMFYREAGAHLIWVLASFSEDYRRMTTDDLLFSNNSNVFVIDEETVRLSEDTKQFHLRCHYRIPFCNGGSISDKWQEAVIPFSAVKKEIERQRAYYFDYEAEEAKCHGTFDQQLRDDVIAYWAVNMTRQMEGRPEHQDRWLVIKEKLAERNVTVPDRPAWDSSFRGMMHAVLSALKGHGVGWGFDTLIQCAHQTAQMHPESLLAFAFALEVAGHKELLKSQDSTGKWASQCEVMRIQLRKGDPKYAPPQEWMPALSFLFPEVGARLAEFVRRNGLSTS
ncbi:DUF6035 family protein [Bradyrhizobium yuanmingense]|uniref:DUF6035 family protein n=1 Tax=Bradyrhizobium yuanmingense TaxID=108015 RepID=UPI0023B97D9F|nr:DUF6035 family protein [Bradyrhizobium yuanmingense]MDF0579225.1 DUF6035 family protein [Bradyrhizobium yuanmingense]